MPQKSPYWFQEFPLGGYLHVYFYMSIWENILPLPHFMAASTSSRILVNITFTNPGWNGGVQIISFWKFLSELAIFFQFKGSHKKALVTSPMAFYTHGQICHIEHLKLEGLEGIEGHASPFPMTPLKFPVTFRHEMTPPPLSRDVAIEWPLITSNTIQFISISWAQF